MKNFKITFTALLFASAFFGNQLQAQGCSDAGFCSVPNGFINPEDENKNNLELGFVYGVGDEDVTHYSQFITYTRKWNERFETSTKLTAAQAEGNFGTRGNLGDLFVTGNYSLNKKMGELASWSVFLGAKIPLTQANDKINGFSIPMAYQASLGTLDLISGVNLVYKKWDFNVSFQLPLTQNKNSFDKELSGTEKFETTNFFERQADILLRSGYKIKSGNKKFTFRPNVLFIYHLGEDSAVNNVGVRNKIKGSDGLTLNGNLIVTYKLTANSYLETSLAAPFVVRDERPDGLTRAFTGGLSYKINF